MGRACSLIVHPSLRIYRPVMKIGIRRHWRAGLSGHSETILAFGTGLVVKAAMYSTDTMVIATGHGGYD
jgi:hypothetical protein